MLSRAVSSAKQQDVFEISSSKDFTRHMKLSLWDALFFSLMVGIGESYLPAFVLAQKMPEYVTGLFSTIPLLVGAFFQLFVPQILHLISSMRKWVISMVLLQASSFLSFIYFHFFPTENHSLVFLAGSIYWFAGFAVTPAWNHWIHEIVPHKKGHRFFSYRQTIVQLGSLLGIVGGGLLLQKQTQTPHIFVLMFGTAMICRLLSAWTLAHHPSRSSHPGKYRFKDLAKIWNHEDYRLFLKFIFLFFMMISVSSPFVTPYFLGSLKMNYTTYMWAIGSLFLAKMLALPLAEKLMDRYGEKNIFLLGALGMSPLPALWSVSVNPVFMCALQAISGVFWAFFEVGMALLFFKRISENQKILVVTAYSFFNAVAIAVGSSLGAAILKNLHQTTQAYYTIFSLGAFLRTAVIVFFIFKVQNQKHLLGNISLKNNS